MKLGFVEELYHEKVIKGFYWRTEDSQDSS